MPPRRNRTGGFGKKTLWNLLRVAFTFAVHTRHSGSETCPLFFLVVDFNVFNDLGCHLFSEETSHFGSQVVEVRLCCYVTI